MGHKNKPRILDDDIELMIRIARHGFVDMDYIQLFAYEGREKKRRSTDVSYNWLCTTS